MIPRRFSWLFDSLVLLLAFFAAYASAPVVQGWVIPGGVFAWPWVIEHLAPPSAAGPFPAIREFAWMLVAIIPGTILFLEMLGGYDRPKRSVWRVLLIDVLAPFLAMSVLALGFFATKQNSWSRLFFFLVTGYSGLALVSVRVVGRVWRRKRAQAGAYARNLVFVGSARNVGLMADYYRQHFGAADYREFGWLNLADQRPDSDLPALPFLGSAGQLGDLAVHRPIHEVVFAAEEAGNACLAKAIADCDYFRLVLRIVPEPMLTTELRDLRWMHAGEPSQLPGIVLRPHEIDSDALFLKRLMDIVVSSVLLVLLAPLFAAIAVAIKITTPRMSVFYPWRVVGQNGVEFTGYKFTTMVEDADELKSNLMALNEMTGPVFKIRHDPRVTALGRFLRKYSLNELPQLWSVLKGDMSLVGPRPAGPHELVRYELWHKRKLCVQSGVTCLWQVRGRNAINKFDDWVRMDLEYIDNWSLWLDLNIIVRTAWVVVRGTGS